jgi:hypothetical protein
MTGMPAHPRESSGYVLTVRLKPDTSCYGFTTLTM